jgi:antitoxin YefM
MKNIGSYLEIPISEAPEQFTSLPERLSEQPGAVAVTRKGKPVLAVLSWELYESIVETLEVLGDEELMGDLRQAIRELSSGKAIDWERAKKEL